jgi:threonine-phosphate decarboxylase
MTNYVHGGNVWREGNPEKWTDFSANLNPLGPPQIMIDKIKEKLDNIIYYPEVGMKTPTDNIARYLHVPPQQVLPTSGGIGALSLITEAIRPKKVVILQPGFVEYMRLANNVGAELIHLPLIKEGRVVYPKKEIKEVLDENTMLFICNPSNPIGSTMPNEIMLEILKSAEKCRAKVVVDEAFIEFAQEDSVKHLVKEYSSLIIAGSLTKIFAIPGIRLGYICANKDTIKSLKERQTPWSLSSFASDVTCVLEETKDYVEKTLTRNEVQREYLREELEKMGITVFPSKANFLLLNLQKKGITVDQLQDKLIKDYILIRNCSTYIYLDEYYTRIAVKSKEANEYLIQCLKKYLGE